MNTIPDCIKFRITKQQLVAYRLQVAIRSTNGFSALNKTLRRLEHDKTRKNYQEVG